MQVSKVLHSQPLRMTSLAFRDLPEVVVALEGHRGFVAAYYVSVCRVWGFKIL